MIDQNRREKIHNAAVDAAYEANERRELSYSQEELIKVAVEAAIQKVEELLA